MADELKACPFCGLPARMGYAIAGFYVGCWTRGCCGEGGDDGVLCFNTEREAVEAWNRRAAPRPEEVPTTAGPMPEVREEKLRATFAAIERFLPTEHVEGCGYRQDDMDEYGGCDCGTFAARQAFEALEDIAYGRAADIRAAMGALGRLYNYNVNPDAESAERDRLTVLALLEWAAGMKGGAR